MSDVVFRNGYADFKIAFSRPFITRGYSEDARLKIGEKVKVHYWYYTPAGRTDGSADPVEITLLSLAR